ncbi:hypothetical protein ABEB36_011122 [Hypothenemus hampei]|uniref:Uncharacterized protein n=1 Tax=Hypothenemus hampei TaxID=57062 RepID=A0ABD1EEB6_HYPHA
MLRVTCIILVFTTVISMSSTFVLSNNIESDATNTAVEKFPWINSRKSKTDVVWFTGKIKVSKLLEYLQEYPWTVIALDSRSGIEKRSNSVNFTPRLGRNLDEEGYSAGAAEKSFFYGKGHGNMYSPRLGRDESTSYA